jgi:hypothetical protein
MNWYTKKSESFIKKAIAMRRDGLLGIGDVGWKDAPSENDIQDAIEYVRESYDIDITNHNLTDAGYVKAEDLPGDSTGWLESEKGSIALPDDVSPEGMENFIHELNQQVSSRDYKIMVNLLLNKQLSPVIAFEDVCIADGRGRVNMANALDIPVKLYILSRRK